MSNTRHAKTGTPFRQERFASSAEFERGLMANLVAKRCELLTDAADRELVWWLQLRSWQEGGFQKLAGDLVASHPDRIATKSMRKYGCKPGQKYTWDQKEKVESEIESQADRDRRFERLARETMLIDCGDYEDRERVLESAKKRLFPADPYLPQCQSVALAELPEYLASICLDPSLSLDGCDPRYFSNLIPALREIMAAEIETARTGTVVTELGRQVYETLDYCQQGRCMVLIDGLARTGKTHSAKAWCKLHPGTARYVQCPSQNDDTSFFRALCKALGVSTSRNYKTIELRNRVEDILQRGDLTLVLDEAHYAWPQGNFRYTMPARISWIMTALVNHGVSVALVTTPQFFRTQNSIEKNSAWTSEQFSGRIGHYQKLPDSLSREDLSAVAKSFLPEGDANSIKALVLYAQGSAKYLAAIESVTRRARFLASKSGRGKVIFADVQNGMKESVIPSDNALAAALAEPKKNGRSRAILNTPLRGDKTSRETKPARMDRAEDTEANAPSADRNRDNLAPV
ncbi:MAG TPA: ATP-binding protein [Verrucomicrobiae bacterium]|nr:ATP-binding protein [Verrucomicrobiae bacterium]